MKRKVLQGIAYFTAFGMAFFQVAPGLRTAAASVYEKEMVEEREQKDNSAFFAEEENQKGNSTNHEEEKNSYLIQTKTEKKYQQVQEHCQEELSAEVESSKELEEEQIMVAQLTTGEAITIASMSGVTIEKDEILNGASFENSSQEEEYIEAVEETVEGAWDVKAVNAEEVHGVKDTIKVAVLDSGYDTVGDIYCSGHENLVDPEWDVNGEDLTGHGTAVTSIIMSGSQDRGTEGIIDDESAIELYSVKVLDGGNQAPVSRVIQGIQWCIDQEIDIINMSFGTTYHSTILEDAIEKAAKEGILMIASVGNTGETTGIVEYPAAFEEVVGVGSVNERMEHSVFSATGEEVELVAPGENVPLSSYWGLVTVGSGTSYAAPHVTAIAALLWAKDSQKSSESIRGLLQKSARELGAKEEFGYGLVDYEYASEIYKEYMASEQQKLEEGIEEEVQIEENDAPIPEYEVPEMVEASWHGDSHYTQVEKSIGISVTGDSLKYVKAGSIAPDRAVEDGNGSWTGNWTDLSVSSYANPNMYYDVLHARRDTNYVAATKCLLNAALTIKHEGNTEAARTNAEIFFSNNYFSSSQTDDERWVDISALEDALYVACFYRLKVKSTEKAVYVEGGVSTERASYQLLGMAMHVATDAYAHQSQIPKAVAKGKSGYAEEYNDLLKIKSDFKNFDDVLTLISMGDAITSNLRYLAREEDITEVHQKIADNVDFLELRYDQGSYFAIIELLFLFGNQGREGELPYVFCPTLLYKEHNENNKYKKYDLKLNGLLDHMTDCGYDLTNYTLITISEWQELSK